ncbi:MAG: 4-hydroxy-3-methylbut-2-enyl diphosphate reductase [Defluviitaleaceae bacterium]|nr:4-hydroxy-3-methylbut-2-enyl diphosphate reductase [Defluviitaleaceae bacterium]
MNIRVPKSSGFCYGVRRSVEAAFQLAREGNAYMYGEVVHNPQVVEALVQSGLHLIHDLSEIPLEHQHNAKILIRAHGVPESVTTEITALGMVAIDMTCPHVKKIHVLVAKAAASGMDVIVCGTPGHPETLGTVSRVTTQAVIVQDLDEARVIIPSRTFAQAGVCLVAQTTHNQADYEAVHDYLAGECPSITALTAHATICGATFARQNELRGMATQADACIIIGGKNSSNVTKLYDIARALCPHTVHIENAASLDAAAFSDAQNIVIAGGASTPAEDVAKVEAMLRDVCVG